MKTLRFLKGTAIAMFLALFMAGAYADAVSVPTSGMATNATYTPGPNGTISFSVNQKITISKDTPLVVVASSGSLATGSGEAWGGSGLFNQVDSGGTSQYNIYSAYGTPQLSPGKVYTLTVSPETSAFAISYITIGLPPVPPASSGSPMTVSYTYAPVGTLGYVQFQVSAQTTISSATPLMITASDGTTKTGSGEAWGDNFLQTPNQYCTFQVDQVPGTTNQYYVYNTAPADVTLYPKTNYYFKLASSGDFNISAMSIGEGSTPSPSAKPVTTPVQPAFNGSSLPLRVGYIQLSGEHAVNTNTLPAAGIQSCNVIIFAFAWYTPGSSPANFTDTPPKEPV